MCSLKLIIFAAIVISISATGGKGNSKAAPAKTYFDFKAAYNRFDKCFLDLDIAGIAHRLTMSPSKVAERIYNVVFEVDEVELKFDENHFLTVPLKFTDAKVFEEGDPARIPIEEPLWVQHNGTFWFTEDAKTSKVKKIKVTASLH